MTISQILARRIGRITFGGVLFGGIGYLVFAACAGLRTAPWIFGAKDLDAARILGMTWVIALGAGWLAWRIALQLRLTGNPEWLFAESVMVPAGGVALCLPLTLHLPVIVGVGDGAAFDTWVLASMWITGLAHVVFAIMTAARAYQLVHQRQAWSPRAIYLATVLTSCVPFVMLYAIPPAIVALTALPFVPMLHAMERVIVRERCEAARIPHLPRAIASIGR